MHTAKYSEHLNLRFAWVSAIFRVFRVSVNPWSVSSQCRNFSEVKKTASREKVCVHYEQVEGSNPPRGTLTKIAALVATSKPPDPFFKGEMSTRMANIKEKSAEHKRERVCFWYSTFAWKWLLDCQGQRHTQWGK